MRVGCSARGLMVIAGLLLAACGRDNAPPGMPAPATTSPTAAPATTGSPMITSADAMRAWLARALTCGDRDFLRADTATQHARLSHMQGVVCEPTAPGAPLRCAIAPALRIGQADVGWFVIGAPQFDLAPVVLPAPQDMLRNAMSAGTGALSPGNDLGDTTVQCALTDEALAPGAIAGTVLRDGDRDSTMRVCAFELSEGVPTCTQTTPGGHTYRLDGLVRGDYLLYALPRDAPDARIGYTDCDPGEAEVPCTHELKVVSVEAGRATEGIDPADLRSLEEAADWPAPPPQQ